MASVVRQGRSVRRVLAFLTATVVVLGLAIPAAQASVSQDEQEQSLVRRVDGYPQTAYSSGTSLWFHSGAGRMYELTGGDTLNGIAMYDTATGASLGQAPLDPPAWTSSRIGPVFGYGQPQTVAVDEPGNRLVIAQGNHVFSPNYVIQNNQPALQQYLRSTTEAPCGIPGQGYALCFQGLHVLDALTLNHLGRIPLQLADATSPYARTGFVLRAMSVTEGGEDAGTKVHVVLEEVTKELIDNSQVKGGVDALVTRRAGAAQTYLVEFDLDGRRQNWSVRLDGCRGSREPKETASAQYAPYPAAVFRAVDAVVVACHIGTNQTSGIMRVPLDEAGSPFPLPVAVGEPALPQGTEPPAAPVSRTPAIESYGGPEKVREFIADPASGRIMAHVLDGADVWWVYDDERRAWVGTVGIGAFGATESFSSTMSGFDPAAGRLYTLTATAGDDTKPEGGLYVADIRGNPIPQALRFPEFDDLVVSTSRALHVAPSGEGRPARLFARSNAGSVLYVIEDHRPVEVVAPPEPAIKTLDLDLVEGVTSTVHDGAARGYGARALLVGGVEGALRAGPSDPVGFVKSGQNIAGNTVTVNGTDNPTLGRIGPFVVDPPVPGPDSCTDVNREVVLGFVGPEEAAVFDMGGSRGAVQPVSVNATTTDDLHSPVSRCAAVDWAALWGNALFGRPPVDEPSVDVPINKPPAQCVSSGEDAQASWGDPVFGQFSGSVQCGAEGVQGWSHARAVDVQGLQLGEALSSFRIYLDPGRGLVARVESVARGINIPGALRIATVRGVAESWANGRKQPVAEADREPGYRANCDYERTAGTCFQPHLFGLWTPGYSCGPCGDEGAAVDAMRRVLGSNASVAFRQPDPRLALGDELGSTAAVQKSDAERFSDLILNNDLVQTTVPVLEIIRYAPHGRPNASPTQQAGSGARGRQIYQFAGVEVSSAFGIQCLLVYDEVANTCAGEKQEPGAIQVSLSDPDGKALAGGAFEVRADVDADGVLGLKDTLLPDGACVTTDDGVGTCTFEGLQPGGYLVNQVAAPPGYAKSAEPFVVELASGEQRTVAFTNVSNLSTVELKATDEHGAPVSGAVFAAYPDPDSDGKVAPDAKPAAECTTDAQGACSMRVPAGSYVLVQTSAPAGLEGIEPVAFTFASGGQVAAVTVVNYPPEQPAAPEGSAAPAPSIGYSPPVDAMPPTEIVGDYLAPDVAPQPDVAEPPVLAQIGDTITQVIRAPGDALRLLARDPKEAVAWTAALALFCLAVMAIRRRQQAIALIDS